MRFCLVCIALVFPLAVSSQLGTVTPRVVEAANAFLAEFERVRWVARGLRPQSRGGNIGHAVLLAVLLGRQFDGLHKRRPVDAANGTARLARPRGGEGMPIDCRPWRVPYLIFRNARQGVLSAWTKRGYRVLVERSGGRAAGEGSKGSIAKCAIAG